MLDAGTRLGHYAIESLLGRGGMGEVYRGHDLRLRRPVAIKVLRDPEAILRHGPPGNLHPGSVTGRSVLHLERRVRRLVSSDTAWQA